MITGRPALAALAAALLLTACADATDGSPVRQSYGPLSTGGAPGVTTFPSSTPSVAPSGGGNSVNSVPAPPSASTGAASTVPTTWTLEVARQMYLTYVGPYNAHIKTLDAVLKNKKSTLSTFHAICGTIAADQLQFGRNLAAGRWPASAQPAVTAFVPKTLEVAAAFRRCASATSVAAANSAINLSPDTQAYANAVRDALGLPKAK